MSTGRLTFLYPHLFRTARLGERATQAARSCPRRTRLPRTGPAFSTSPVVQKPPARAKKTATAAAKATPLPNASPAANAKRSSSAATPIGSRDASTSRDPVTETIAVEEPQAEAASKEPQRQASSSSSTTESESKASEQEEEEEDQLQQRQQTPNPNEAIPMGPPRPDPAPSASASAAAESPKGTAGPMDAILQMGPPSEQDPKNKPPHLSPPPYVHYFDTYSLVKELSSGGSFTEPQAITSMKAVRQLLAYHLDIAQSGLVSKSDVENETYLFRAACSELGTEVHNNRRVADEQIRQQRTTLQHEVDILTQGMNTELLSLNDSVRGMFNDRRMAVREEQKAVDSAIQQISYKISLMLTSDAKSEIEGLRWVLIRRSVLGIIFMAVLMFGSLRYGSYVTHEKQKEAERVAQEKRAKKRHPGSGTHDNAHAADAAEMLASN